MRTFAIFIIPTSDHRIALSLHHSLLLVWNFGTLFFNSSIPWPVLGLCTFIVVACLQARRPTPRWQPCPPFCCPGPPVQPSCLEPQCPLTGTKKSNSGSLRNTTVEKRTNPAERLSISPDRREKEGGCVALFQPPTKVVVEQF